MANYNATVFDVTVLYTVEMCEQQRALIHEALLALNPLVCMPEVQEEFECLQGMFAEFEVDGINGLTS